MVDGFGIGWRFRLPGSAGGYTGCAGDAGRVRQECIGMVTGGHCLGEG